MQTLYLDATHEAIFQVEAGQTYTPAINGALDWMHTYAFIDYNRDGVFTPLVETKSQTVKISNWQSKTISYSALSEGSELVSFSANSLDYTGGATGYWCNSVGTYLGDINSSNQQTMPSFTIPANLQSGLYRMRFKVDWNSLDAGGNDGSDGTKNQIWSNGGGIVDVLLDVTGVSDVPVRAFSYKNGSLWHGKKQITDEGLTAQYGEAYQVKSEGKEGYVPDSLVVFYKANSTTNAGLLVMKQTAYAMEEGSDFYTLPADVMYSDVTLRGVFVRDLLLGDVNRDGQITIADVTALVNIILGKDDSEPYQYDHEAADVNQDGDITIADVTALVNLILGKQ